MTLARSGSGSGTSNLRQGASGQQQGNPGGLANQGGQQAWLVTASQESLGGSGYMGNPIKSTGYSELSINPANQDFSALGDLPYQTALYIHNPQNGRTVRAEKQDIGAGSSFLPVMGLYPGTSSALGLTGGSYKVIIWRADGQPLRPARGTQVAMPSGSTPGVAKQVGNTVAGTGGAAPTGAGSGGDFILGFGSLFSIAASDLAQFIFDAFIKFPAMLVGDWIIRPAWHWNQRAVMYFQQSILWGDSTGVAQVTTAVFWAFGYVLLWGDPDAKGFVKKFTQRVPAHRSHLARVTRTSQAVPARRKLIKPKDVKQATAKKPPPVESTVPITLVGTMTTHRAQRVSVNGHTADRTSGRQDANQRAGTRTPQHEQRHRNTQHTTPTKPHTQH